MDNLEHWLCTNCGQIDGARAGMVCHGPAFTGICTALGETVVEISPGAVKRLRGAVEALRGVLTGRIVRDETENGDPILLDLSTDPATVVRFDRLGGQ